MSIKYSLLLFFIILFSNIGVAQSSEKRFVQFIITNLDTKEKAIEIDQFMRTQKGIEISRTDVVSKKYLCIYNASYPITRASFEKWIKELDIEYKCYREGTQEKDSIIDQKQDCE